VVVYWFKDRREAVETKRWRFGINGEWDGKTTLVYRRPKLPPQARLLEALIHAEKALKLAHYRVLCTCTGTHTKKCTIRKAIDKARRAVSSID
jgi:hypothetical protein